MLNLYFHNIYLSFIMIKTLTFVVYTYLKHKVHYSLYYICCDLIFKACDILKYIQRYSKDAVV